ncbi:EAL domain-containing response regulator [Vibrio campbellii]|uniref:EAL domain-containing response regulator n=1 Tax=Vibrio campbellii TaxID=680 RepID=UPI000682491B|nr:EAL domain-containing response regulator [Vibrio campbellii]ARR45997.1 diguanylate phosphodiesterase [Vibrio campbellii]HDM8229272.1 EAL domain-containing response regulator [Vibrio campbellii]
MNKSLNAMVIDDHPLQITLLKQMLLRHEVSVSTFEDVDAAIRHAKESYVDIIFCDLQMPDKDGIDMMEMLNQIGYQGKVVLVSAMELTIVTAVRAMCETFSFEVLGKLLKPYEESQVVEMLRRVGAEPAKTRRFHQDIYLQDQEFLFALAEGRVKNYYQPLADANTGEVIGYEALARWSHPIYGVLGPHRFLSIVERCHLSAELFEAVFSNALYDMKNRGFKHHISLNVDHENLEDPEFANQFIERCDENGICPDHFTIEITERDTFQSSPALYKNLLKFRMNGVTISIDDFGTGSSSLEKLAQLPFNELKIDRSFVQGLVHDPKKKNIVLAICALAKSLNISVVAEGVEDEKTLDAMRHYTVDVCQGYFIDKPMPLEAITILK